MTVLDTNILIYLLEGRLAEPLPKEPIRVSIISEIELLAYPKIDETAEQHIRDLLRSLEIVNLTPPIKEAAIMLRRNHGLDDPGRHRRGHGRGVRRRVAD